MSMMACTASGECSVGMCESGACRDVPKSAGSACSTGKCDANGECVACLAPSDCKAASDCVTPTCSGGACGSTNKPKGMPCGTNGAKKCDGNGSCASACGDGTVDPNEACDPMSPQWVNSGGACSPSCTLTSEIFHACRVAGQECWPGSPPGYFCSDVGACSRICSGLGDECGPTGMCVADNHQKQNICVTMACPGGEFLQWYGTQGCTMGKATKDPSTGNAYPQCMTAIDPQRMCGWVSADPVTGVLWCPGGGPDCCPPGGGQCCPAGSSSCTP